MSFVTIISNHLLPLFFVYGLAFFSLGLAASLQHTEDSTFGLRDCLWALAVFGFLHGMSEWADMFSALGDAYWTPLGSVIIQITGFYLALASFVFLLDFGVSAAVPRISASRASRIVSRTGSLIFVFLITRYGFSTRLSSDWLLNSNILTRYLLAIPASGLAAVGFAKHGSLSGNDNYSQQMTAANGIGTVAWSKTAGNLPPGIALGTNGSLTGIATANGTYSFTLQATDSATPPQTATVQESIQVVDPVKITSSPNLPDACLNQPYTFTPTKTGGLAPFNWGITGFWIGIFPDPSTGVFSGSSPVTGTYSVLFGVSDATNTGDSQTITLTINQCP